MILLCLLKWALDLRLKLAQMAWRLSWSMTTCGNFLQTTSFIITQTAPPHRSGLYSTLAISYPRWWPCQIQVLSQKLTSGAPGRGRQVGRCPPKIAHFVPQNSLFWPKTALKPTPNGQTKGNGCYTPRAPRLPRDHEFFLAL